MVEFFLDCWAIEDEGPVIPRNDCNHSASDATSHARGPESSASPLWERQVSKAMKYVRSIIVVAHCNHYCL